MSYSLIRAANMTSHSDPERAAVRKFLLELAPRFFDEDAPDHTDAEHRAITKLINCGLVEAEYKIEIDERSRQRAATVILRVSKSAADMHKVMQEVVLTAGWYGRGDPLGSAVQMLVRSQRFRLTYDGELAAADLRTGSEYPVNFALEPRLAGKPQLRFMGIEQKTPPTADDSLKANSSSQNVAVNVEFNPQIDVTSHIHLPSAAEPAGEKYADRKAADEKPDWQSIEDVRRQLPKLAASDCSILILGETGVGKEFYARQIHEDSPRSKKPFAPINCATLPKERIDAELFGHRRGTFTGAERDRAGRIKDAAGGTVLLDELGILPMESWGNLLRFLQDREISPVGGPSESIDVRIIAATNRPNALPEDIQHRFDAVLRLPPLRARREEIGELAKSLFDEAVKLHDKTSLRLTKEEREALACDPFEWPGNIRQLQKSIQNAVLMHEGIRNLTAKEILPAAKALSVSL